VRRLMTLLTFLATAVMSAQELPEGPGRPQVIARCSICHEADLIAQQRLSRAGWGREIDKMVRWGALVDTQEREAMLDYLAAHFPPKALRQAQGRAVATHNAITTTADDAYKRACLVCHAEDLIEAQRLTRAGWAREVDKMIRWGAVVPDSEKPSVIDYLTARFPVR
jgi:cytochrome c5